MNKLVEAYVQKQMELIRRDKEKQKEKELIKRGLYKKETKETYQPGFALDEQIKKYVKKVPIEVSDEEYNLIIGYSYKDYKMEQFLYKILSGIGIFFYIAGLLIGLYVMFYSGKESAFISSISIFFSAFISGSLFFGLARILKLLIEIRRYR